MMAPRHASPDDPGRDSGVPRLDSGVPRRDSGVLRAQIRPQAEFGLEEGPLEAVPTALAGLHAALAVGESTELAFNHTWQPEDAARVIAGAGFTLEKTLEKQTARGDSTTIRARRERTLPDFVGPKMRILVCGLNPSLVAADAGFGFAGATNRFWPAAVAAGLVSEHRQPRRILAKDGVGMTDLVKRATPRASEVTPAEFRAGAERVAWLVEWLQPRLVLFVGLQGWRAAADRTAIAGPQRKRFGGRPVYVMPSTSGLNARISLSELTEHMKRAISRARR
jgi:TDG/mug DNA glycosylase family protein